MPDTHNLPSHLQAGLEALTTQMVRHGHGRDAPARAVFALLGDRWTTLILLVLAIGEWRHAELRRVLCRISAEGSISQRVLTLKLRTLERDGFVQRHTTADVPPRVSYRLTEMGEGLVAMARRQLDWVNARGPAILSARAAFDARED